MFYYSAYGLILGSEIELPWRQSDRIETPDLVLAVEPFTDDMLRSTDQGFRIRSRIANVGRVFVDGGRWITIEPGWTCSDSALASVLVGPVLALALRQRGLCVLHASAVEMDGRAHLFVGNSGMGKSTAALSLIAHGARFVTDDLAVISFEEQGAHIRYGPPLAKLHSDSSKLLVPSLSGTKVCDGSEKTFFEVGEVEFSRRVPIGSINFIRLGTQFEMAPMASGEYHSLLCQHTWGTPPLIEPEFLKQVFDSATRLARTVKGQWWTRSDEVDRLPEVISRLVADGVFDSQESEADVNA